MEQNFCIWLTGLPCSGKSTIAKELKEKIEARGNKVYILDGDIVRKELNEDLRFSREDRFENIRRVSVVAKILTQCDVIPIVALVSPYKEPRNKARERIKNFVEVFVKAPVDVCMERDVKGMYKKAMDGEIKDFTGVNDPYEEPENPEVICETGKESPGESADKIIQKLEGLGFLEQSGYTEEEEEMVKKRLEDLGYI